jgi:outer membrane protein
MNNVLKFSAIALGVASVLAGTAVRADDDDGPWEVRLRAVYLDPANKSDAIPSLGVPENAIHVNGKALPDLDFEYFFTPNWSTELVLTYPQKQTVTVEQSVLGGPVQIGTFKHLPPTLTGKYDFLPNSDFQPYLGVGVNLTFIMDVDLNVPTVGPLALKTTSVGPAAQAGFDYKIAPHWYLNADVKWAQIRSDVSYDAQKISQVRIDPFLFGVGVGYRFGGNKQTLAQAPTPAPVAAPAPPPPPPPPPPAAVVPPPPPPPPAQELVLKGVTFATASAKLEPGSTAILDGVANTIQQCHCSKVDIRGYTDSVGKPAYNQKLSDRRANAVKEYLEAHGVAAGVLTAQGFGEENPIASNKTAEGRAENRRVTVQFTAPVSR